MDFKKFIKNAFAIDETLEESEKQFLNKLAEKIHKRKLNQLIALFSDVMQPIGFITGQFIYYGKALLVPAVLSANEFNFFVQLISKRCGWDYFSKKLHNEE